MPQLRQNIITGEWVVIAPERAKRPQDFVTPKSVDISKKDGCLFCVGSPSYKSRLKSEDSTNIYVIQNKFPAFIEDDKLNGRSFYVEDEFYRARPSIGDHEVVIIKNHDLNIFKFSNSLMHELFQVIQKRFIRMKENEEITSIMPIYNHGAEAGASITHPHAQIFASGVVANTVGREMEGAERYFGINGVCVFCDLIKHEKKQKVRMVAENKDFIAFTFYAARFPFEIWLMPKKHDSQFANSSQSLIKSLAEIMTVTLGKLDKTLKNPPLNFYIHTLPTILDGSNYYHWHVEITPRLSLYGGFEIGSGVIIDVMNPEDAAGYLNGKKKD